MPSVKSDLPGLIYIYGRAELCNKKLKRRKSPGPDRITNEMLTYAGKPVLYKLLEIFNKTWQEGSLPQSWREATMIPIHKKEKSKTEAKSYRPISLTSCVVKLLEKIINA